MTVSESLLVCSVYKLIPWFVFESSIQIKRSDPADLDTDWGKKRSLWKSPGFAAEPRISMLVENLFCSHKTLFIPS